MSLILCLKEEKMYEFYGDFHVHIGRTENNKPIKITAARSLNFANIAKECVERKGINIVGIIDCASPYVIEDIENLPGFKLIAKVATQGKTGVEMEALTSVSIGLLTIYDMIKAIDKSMIISDIALESKSGGKSGEYRRENGSNL